MNSRYSLNIIGAPLQEPKSKPISTIDQIESHYGKEIQEKLRTVFKHQNFRTGQREVILAALQGRDAWVLMPTG
jgi:superfamily II DNA helicase RecQ